MTFTFSSCCPGISVAPLTFTFSSCCRGNGVALVSFIFGSSGVTFTYGRHDNSTTFTYAQLLPVVGIVIVAGYFDFFVGSLPLSLQSGNTVKLVLRLGSIYFGNFLIKAPIGLLLTSKSRFYESSQAMPTYRGYFN